MDRSSRAEPAAADEQRRRVPTSSRLNHRPESAPAGGGEAAAHRLVPRPALPRLQPARRPAAPAPPVSAPALGLPGWGGNRGCAAPPSRAMVGSGAPRAAHSWEQPPQALWRGVAAASRPTWLPLLRASLREPLGHLDRKPKARLFFHLSQQPWFRKGKDNYSYFPVQINLPGHISVPQLFTCYIFVQQTGFFSFFLSSPSPKYAPESFQFHSCATEEEFSFKTTVSKRHLKPCKPSEGET